MCRRGVSPAASRVGRQVWVARREARNALCGIGDAPFGGGERAAEHRRYFGELHPFDEPEHEYRPPATVDAIQDPVERAEGLALFEYVLVRNDLGIRHSAVVG